MTNLSIAALLLLGIAAGPFGLNLVTGHLLSLLDPGIAMAAAMLGVFVGLSVDVRRPASRMGEILLILAGGLLVATFRAPSPGGAIGLTAALAAISATISIAAWLLVRQTSSEGEQHVFVVGALLLMGGAATYLALSATFAGLLAGLGWSLAGSVAKVRIVRDLDYFQHPLVVLALLAAGAAAALSVEALMAAVALVAVRAVLMVAGSWLTSRAMRRETGDEEISALVPAGLVIVALALDLFRAEGRPEWAVTLLAAVVLAEIASQAISAFSSGQAGTT